MVKFIFLTLLISTSACVQGETLADPTQPLNFQVKKQRRAEQPRLPSLQSIVVKSGRSQAILNNKLYQQGQSVNGYQISLIDAQKVLLNYQNKTYTLTLYSSNERFIE